MLKSSEKYQDQESILDSSNNFSGITIGHLPYHRLAAKKVIPDPILNYPRTHISRGDFRLVHAKQKKYAVRKKLLAAEYSSKPPEKRTTVLSF